MNRYLVLFLFLMLSVNGYAQQWESIAPMNSPRAEAEAVELHDGTILVVGGYANGAVTGTCEIYDRKTDSWHMTGSLNVARFRFALNILPSGKVVALGGLTDLDVGTTNSCEVYDPTTGVWTSFGTLPESTENFPTCYLDDSTLVFLGGLDANITNYVNKSGKIDPSSLTLSPIAPMLIGTYSDIGVYLHSYNEIVVAGGAIGGLPGPYLLSTQIYNFHTNQWILGDSLSAPVADGNHHQVKLANDRIVVPGGRTGPNTVTPMVQEFNPATGVWNNPGNLPRPHFHCYSILVGQDSILTIAGAIDPAYTQDIVSYTDWYNCNNDSGWEGPDMIEPRHVYSAVNALFPVPGTCSDSDVIYVFGGETTGKVQINTCEKLVIGLKPDTNAHIPTTLTLPMTSETVRQVGCASVDTEVQLGVAGCGITSGELDSAWISGSQSFAITDARPTHRTIATADSIEVGYLSSAATGDTAYLHLAYNIGSGEQDTVVELIGNLASPVARQPEQTHRESASAYYGAVDSLTLALDMSSSVNVDSLWPTLTDIEGTYTWDSSIVTYAGFLAPSGWAAISLSDRGDSLDFEIQKLSGIPTAPLALGTALFTPVNETAGTSWVMLSNLSLIAGGHALALCVTDNEDNHWAVKSLGVLSGVVDAAPTNVGIVLYPDPASDNLFAQNPNPVPASILIYDALGRELVRATADASSTTALDLRGLPSGMYLARTVCGNRTDARTIVKQ